MLEPTEETGKVEKSDKQTVQETDVRVVSPSEEISKVRTDTKEKTEMLPRNDRLMFQLSQFIQEQIESAFNKYMEDRKANINPDKDIIEYIKEIWDSHDDYAEDSDGDLIFELTNSKADNMINFRDEFDDVAPHVSIFFTDSSYYDPNSGTLCLKINHIRNAQTEDELFIALSMLLQAIYHEVEHIYNPGTFHSGNVKSKFEYYSHPNEIRGHAKQFAFHYMEEFPGEPFDVEKMRSIAHSPGEKSYFFSMLDSAKQEEYKEFGDILEIHKKAVEMTKKFMEDLSRYRQLNEEGRIHWEDYL